MPLISMRKLLDCAAKHQFAVAGFNINNMEQIQAIMAAAEESKSPVIMQVSRGALKYTQDKFIERMVQAALDLYPSIPIVLHLDHGDSLETCKRAIDLGFTSVMIDGSIDPKTKEPNSYEKNKQITEEVVRYAHRHGISVEGELACIGSIEKAKAGKSQFKPEDLLTDPEEAQRFVKETGVDSLAIAIGTSHGVYKFEKEPDGKVLFVDRITEIHNKIPHCHLVMHGSSSIPQALLQCINQYGGNISETYGVPISEIQKGIKAGVRKVNVDTDLRLAMTSAVRKVLHEQKDVFDPRIYMGAARDAMKTICLERMLAFGQIDKIQFLIS
ncbi:ketose-bisphosphate aldolase [Candidatus Similichlamydia laticola]|uniref:fructose-bisphosphate aldolase n=1 Tax=Candidatus Similichlamydia laticola TaxID=2170265 RepID=A0A369KA63_9BACT|nr:ketose-bisphosphate aldolase [Candidatus Similichlamydia laticola]RDB31489.1 Fructose-bisphosphate aldolase class II [Candidatus Similichlamydia laticola]